MGLDLTLTEHPARSPLTDTPLLDPATHKALRLDGRLIGYVYLHDAGKRHKIDIIIEPRFCPHNFKEDCEAFVRGELGTTTGDVIQIPDYDPPLDEDEYDE